MITAHKRRLGILLSGRGSNFEAIADNIRHKRLPCEVGFVFSNRPDAPGLARAQALGLPCGSIPSIGYDRASYDEKVAELLTQHHIDLVCLAGYMRLLSGNFVSRFSGRILNIHPSLLPAFPGLDAQYQALVHGAKVTGCTVHFVDEGLDSGPIIAQASVPVLDEDSVESLSARILQQEHRLYSEAIAMVITGKFRLEGRRVLAT